jgi:hypothetical protein
VTAIPASPAGMMAHRAGARRYDGTSCRRPAQAEGRHGHRDSELADPAEPPAGDGLVLDASRRLTRYWRTPPRKALGTACTVHLAGLGHHQPRRINDQRICARRLTSRRTAAHSADPILSGTGAAGAGMVHCLCRPARAVVTAVTARYLNSQLYVARVF